jgi:hypothetical protein
MCHISGREIMNVLQEEVCRNKNVLADVSKNGNDGGIEELV